jgi:MATE family multidrug resistance protein
MSMSGLLFLLAPGLLARALTPDPEVVAAAIPLIGVAGVFQLSDGIQGVGAGVLRGAGDTRFAFLANLVGHYAIGLPIAVALGLWSGRGVPGLWWGLCAGLTAVGVSLFVRFCFWVLSSKPIARLDGPPPSH